MVITLFFIIYHPQPRPHCGSSDRRMRRRRGEAGGKSRRIGGGDMINDDAEEAIDER